MHKKRLETIASLVNPEYSCIDVGTDHGYLPIFLKKKYPYMKIAASDINSDPLNNAKKNFQKEGINDIDTYLSNGLISVENQYQIIVITGMGTHTIIEILENSPEYLKNVKYLILSSHQNLLELRKWLWDNEYKIDDEIVVKDGKYYEVFKVSKSLKKIDYINEDLIFGKFRFDERKDDFIEKWKYELNKKLLIKKQMEKEKDIIAIDEEIKQINTILKIEG